MVSESTVDTALKVVVPVSLIGIGAYVVYKFANPTAPGGRCDQPGSPCYSAIQPFQQILNQCSQQYADLMGQIIKQGAAPTPDQESILAQLRNCMDSAAQNLAATASGFKPASLSDLITYAGEVALAIGITYAAAKWGLPGLATFINRLRSGGNVTTPPTAGAGIAALITGSFVQYAVSQGLVTSRVALAWRTELSTLNDGNIAALSYFWNSLVNLNLITTSQALSMISLLNSSIFADFNTTVFVLLAAPMLGEETFQEAPPAELPADQMGSTAGWPPRGPEGWPSSPMDVPAFYSEDCGCG